MLARQGRIRAVVADSCPTGDRRQKGPLLEWRNSGAYAPASAERRPDRVQQFNNSSSPIDCTITNLSNRGARVQVLLFVTDQRRRSERRHWPIELLHPGAPHPGEMTSDRLAADAHRSRDFGERH